MNLSENQSNVLKRLMQWYFKVDKVKYPFVTVGGYAGTGKTTLIGYFRNELKNHNPEAKVAFCSFTGKAARVLKNRLTESKSIFPEDFIGTIHSLIYSPLLNSANEIVGWDRRQSLLFDLIIVDEASMVDQSIWSDILSYNLPVIAVGDHGQLPPVNSKFNLMENPMLKLEEIYRQAKDNPIIELSIMARTQGYIPPGKYGVNIAKYLREEPESQEKVSDLLQGFNNETLVLTGFNTTRIRLNKYVRNILGFESDNPMPRDRVICLKNNHSREIYNGMLGFIENIEDLEDFYKCSIRIDDDGFIYSGNISKEQFNLKDSKTQSSDRRPRNKDIDYFDFGYALTVHKAQGSQARRVILFEERSTNMDDDDWKRWLYTGITRAQEELFIFGK